ncbi:uncharacterized protein PgNI_04729, partial [Pyricularia grisea]|uniref:Uncharacterized protein n=1 Tax=Pyricularia grisea TaxID=148305 RepID=A0A6P8B8K6_PYRGI
ATEQGSQSVSQSVSLACLVSLQLHYPHSCLLRSRGVRRPPPDSERGVKFQTRVTCQRMHQVLAPLQHA